MTLERALPSRRTFLGLAGGSLAGGALAGCSASKPPAGLEGTHNTSGRVTPYGEHQAGLVTPNPAQPQLQMIVYDVSGDPATLVAALGRTVVGLTSGTDAHLAGMEPGDLTVTVGIGPRLVAAVDPGLPGASPLPAFGAHENLTATDTGGDLMVQICASDPLVLPGAVAAVGQVLGSRVTERWRQRAFRGPNVPVTTGGSAPRNLLGFVDGIVVPRSDADLSSDVWVPSGRASGGTVLAVRRMELDVERFTALPVAKQEAVFGRRRANAAPLSGGGIATDPDLGAKTPAGAYVIPADAHLRRANPNATGVPTMLRRSYSFDDTSAGLLFISAQRSLQTFVATLDRMTTMDALLGFTTTTRSASFLVLPGFSASRALGASLFGSEGA